MIDHRSITTRQTESCPINIKKMKSSGSCHNTRVRFSVPQEAAEHLRYLAKVNVQALNELGILGVQINDNLRRPEQNFDGRSNNRELQSFLAGNCWKTTGTKTVREELHSSLDESYRPTFLFSQQQKNPAGNFKMVPYAVRPSVFAYGGYNQARPSMASSRAPARSERECQSGVAIPRQQFVCPSANEFVFHNRQHQNLFSSINNSPIYGQSPPYVPAVFPGTGQMFAGCPYTSLATGHHPTGVVSYVTMAEQSSSVTNPTILNDGALFSNTFQTDANFGLLTTAREASSTKKRQCRRKKNAAVEKQNGEHETSSTFYEPQSQVVVKSCSVLNDSLPNSLLTLSSALGIRNALENVVSAEKMKDSSSDRVVCGNTKTGSKDFAYVKVKRRRKKSTLDDKSNIDREPVKSTQQCHAIDFPANPPISCVVIDVNSTGLTHSRFSGPEASSSESRHFPPDATARDFSIPAVSVSAPTLFAKLLKTRATKTTMDSAWLQSAASSSQSMFLSQSLIPRQHRVASTYLSTKSWCEGAVGLVDAVVAGDAGNELINTEAENGMLSEISQVSEFQDVLTSKSEGNASSSCQDLLTVTTTGNSLENVRENYLEDIRENSLIDARENSFSSEVLRKNTSEDVRENSVENVRENSLEDVGDDSLENVRLSSSQDVLESFGVASDGKKSFEQKRNTSKIDLKTDLCHLKSDDKKCAKMEHVKKENSTDEDPAGKHLTIDSTSNELFKINAGLVADCVLTDDRQHLLPSKRDLLKLDSKTKMYTLQAVKDCGALMLEVENGDSGNGGAHNEKLECSEKKKKKDRLEPAEDASFGESRRLFDGADSSQMTSAVEMSFIDFRLPLKNEGLPCKQDEDAIENSSDEVVARVRRLNGSLDGNSADSRVDSAAYSFLKEDTVCLKNRRKRENSDLTLMESSDESVHVVRFNNEHDGLDLHRTMFNQNCQQTSSVLLPEDFRQLNALVVCEFKNMLRSSSVRKMLLAGRWREESSEDGDGIPCEDATLRRKVSHANKKQNGIHGAIEKSRKRMNGGGLPKQDIDIRGYAFGENGEQLSPPTTKKHRMCSNQPHESPV